jgi:hypothetical protein
MIPAVIVSKGRCESTDPVHPTDREGSTPC